MTNKPRLLLLDRPKELSQGDWEGQVRLGPWANPVADPLHLQTPDLEPYPTAESVKLASNRSHEAAASLFEHVVKTIPEHLKLDRPLGRRFWEVFLSWYVTHIAGVVEDIRVRCGCLNGVYIIYGAPRNEIPGPPQRLLDYIPQILTRSALRIRITDLCARSFLNVAAETPVLYHEETAPEPPTASSGSVARRTAERVLFKLLTGFRTPPAALWDRYGVGLFDLFRLARAGLPLFRPDSRLLELPDPEPDMQLRAAVFQGLPAPYGQVLQATFPAMALEGLQSAIDAGRRIVQPLHGKTEHIYTFGQVWTSTEAMRAAASLLADDGARVTSLQHGGVYAAYDASSSTHTDTTVPDRFISWGWEEPTDQVKPSDRFVAAPSLYLSRLSAKKPKQMAWDVVFLVFAEDLYPKWIYSPVFPELAQDYFQREKVLFDGFSQVERVAVKSYAVEYGWKQNDWIRNEYPQFSLSPTGRFTEWARSSKIAIVDYSGTGMLELLAMDRPFMFTWNRRWFHGPANFEEHLDRLAEVSVFFENPADLVATYQNIKGDIDAWWDEPSRREVVRSMARKYAWASKDALPSLVRLVRSGESKISDPHTVNV